MVGWRASPSTHGLSPPNPWTKWAGLKIWWYRFVFKKLSPTHKPKLILMALSCMYLYSYPCHTEHTTCFHLQLWDNGYIKAQHWSRNGSFTEVYKMHLLLKKPSLKIIKWKMSTSSLKRNFAKLVDDIINT